MSEERAAALLARCKLRVRKASDSELDRDIEQLISAAAEDLVRFGVKSEDVDEGSPLIDEAIIVFVLANYGGNPDRDKLMDVYMSHCTRLVFSEHRRPTTDE